MKIVIFEAEEWERTCFERFEEEHDVVFVESKLTGDTVGGYADADIISTFINSDLSEKVLEKFDHLKFIATRSTGFDHIAIGCCDMKDLVVSNVPTYGDTTVAEHAFGLLLTISHSLNNAINRTKKGDFSLGGLQGFDLKGKKLGVVGTGNIGMNAIRIARGFGMEVIAYDVKTDDEAAARLGFTYVDMDTLLGEADIITLHVPANDKTRHMISFDEFEKMKDQVVIINTSRGSIIEMEALVEALAKGKIQAAGLDVLPEEPVVREEAELLRSIYRKEHNLETLLADHALLRLNNVVITPHSAFDTKEAVQRILDTTAANIESFLGGEPQNVVS